MSKSNWKGGSGWTAVSDPTRVLSGKTLVATAGLSQVTEDYLLQLPQTTTAFSENHYSVIMNYAFPQSGGLHPLSMGCLGLIARAGSFSGSKALDAYIGKIDAAEGTISICRRNSDTETVLSQCELPSDVLSRGVRHAMELKCVGTNPTSLQFSVDNTVFCTFGDVSSSILSSGFPGIYVKSGTAFVDNFSAVKYTSTGSNATEWLPSDSSTTIAAWFKADSGITSDSGTSKISAWNDSGSNSNNLSQSTTANQPTLEENYVLDLPVVSFNNSTDVLAASDSASLDLSTNISIFIAIAPRTLDVGAVRTILTKGSGSPNYSVGLTALNAPVYTAGGSNEASTGTLSENSIQLLEIITGSNFYINGTSAGTITIPIGGSNTDELRIPFADGGKIAEIIIFSDAVSDDDRLKIEGYLANKWKTTDLLPTSHPYKYFSPLV